MAARPWTRPDLERLKAMKLDGARNKVIAAELGRTEAAVVTRLHDLKVRGPKCGMASVRARIPGTIKDALAREAHERGTTLSQVIRERLDGIRVD